MRVGSESESDEEEPATSTDAQRRAAGRPRDETVDAALLRSAQDLLIDLGYDRLSIDAVAARARTSKTAVYRRWPGKAELVVAAVEQLYVPPDVPDTGSLRDDLLACARTYLGRDDRTQRVLTGLLTAMVRNESLRSTALQAVGRPYAEQFEIVLQRAVQRGVVPQDADIDTIACIFPAIAFHRVAVEGRPVDEDLILRIVDNCLIPLTLHPA